jgi:hypothetical protein
MVLDSKGRTVLSTEQASIVVFHLCQIRGTDFHDRPAVAKNWRDTREVLLAATNAAFGILPQGSIDNVIKEMSGGAGILISEAMPETLNLDPEGKGL